MTLGTILGAAFQVLRRNPKPTFGFALVIMGVVTLATVIGTGALFAFSFTRIESATAEDRAAIEAGSVALSVVTVLVIAAVSIVASAILQGVISLEVARGTVAEKLTLRGLLAKAKGRIGALVGWSVLVALAVIVAIAIFAVIIGLLFATSTSGGVVGGILVALVGSAGAAVLAAWLGTKLSLVPSAILLERLPLGQAVRRSWSLVKGNFWRVFGIQILVLVIVQTASSVISIPFSVIAPMAITLVNPNQDATASIVAILAVTLLSLMVTLVISALAVVIQSATAALLYIDLRMRKEGFDLTLSAFVEARQTGVNMPDPYLPAAAPGTGTTATYI